jgi:hypothetical protein
MRLAAERNLDRLLSMIIDETTAVMNSERSSLFLINEEKDACLMLTLAFTIFL